MIIACPHCSTGYLLPEHLLGPGGARVRCPRCREPFAVSRAGRVEAGAPAAADPAAGTPALAEMRPTTPPPAAVEKARAETTGPLAIARGVLEELEGRAGEALERARAGRRLFAEFGPLLMEAYDAYRRQAGPAAGPAPFREALRERWGVELVPLGLPRG